MVQAGLTRTKDYSLVMVVAVVVVIVVVAALRYDHYWYLVECCLYVHRNQMLVRDGSPGSPGREPRTGAQDGSPGREPKTATSPFTHPPGLCSGTASVPVLIVVIV